MKRTLLTLASVLVFLSLHAQDCPELNCHIGLTASILPQEDGFCYIDVLAENLIENDLSNCSSPLSYAIYRQTDVDAAGVDFIPEFTAATSFIRLTEDDDHLITVSVFVRDGDQSVQSCETYLLMESHIACQPAEEDCFIAGYIGTERMESVIGVDVSFTGLENHTLTTSSDGAFSLTSTPCDSDFQLEPHKNDLPTNGVSTFDIVLLNKHILGVQLLDSPYKLIAADVNQSGSLSVLDIIHIRRLVLNFYTEFPNSPSWRFVAADYEFPIPDNPWHEAFPEVIFISNTDEFLSLDFIAIKMGDLNGNADTN